MRRKAIIAILATVAAAFLLLYFDFRLTDSRSLLHAADAQGISPYAFYARMEKRVAARRAVPVLTAAQRAGEDLPDGGVTVLESAEDTRIALSSACAPELWTLQAVLRRMRCALGREDAQICLTGRTQRTDIEQTALDLMAALGDAPRESLVQESLVSLMGSSVQVAIRADDGGARVYIGRPYIPIEY